MTGETVSKYRILERIGEGGMGVVYKAEDTTLRRIVAIKFPAPQALGSETDRVRLVREAQTAAALDHANICTIYEIGEHDGKTFIVMAYVDGQELKEKIDLGPLRLETAIHVAMQTAEGLRAAHEKGLVHRDVKSSNIMITDRGQVKIMDFGLAKPASGEQITKETSTMGTVAYMSPEQTRGDPVDARTDIWALGVVMYEMLTGRRPFRGDYEQSVIYAIVNEEPEPVTALRTGIPMEFERIVTKCLAKNPKHRYQHIEDLIVDLRRLKMDLDSKEVLATTRSSPVRRKRRAGWLAAGAASVAMIAVAAAYFLGRGAPPEDPGDPVPIAVADFTNETGDPQLDGLSGMLITSLEQSRKLSVITRSRMFDILRQMGRTEVDRIDETLGRDICGYAGVDALVVAWIRKFDELYTIDLKVFDTVNNRHIFATRSEGKGLGSIPGMIDKLARDTREGLKERSAEIRLASDEVATITTPDLEAYKEYFAGEQLVNQLDFEGAKEAYLRAVARDSTFALAWYRLAYATWWKRQDDVMENRYLVKAAARMDRLPEKYRYLLRAQKSLVESGYAAGVEVLREAEARYPEDKEILYNIGDYSFHIGRYGDAERYLTRVLEIDPVFQRALQHLFMTYSATGDYRKALDAAERYHAAAASAESYVTLAAAYLQGGDAKGAGRIVSAGRLAFPADRGVAYEAGVVALARGDFEGGKAVFDSLLAAGVRPVAGQNIYQALVASDVYLGRYRDALKTLEAGFNESIAAADTFTAVTLLLSKPITLLRGWGDSEKALAATVELLPFARYAETVKFFDLAPVFWGSIADVKALAGKTDESEALAREKLRGNRLRRLQTMFLVYAARGDDRAVAHADSLVSEAPRYTRVLVHGGLAEMFLARGEADRALEELRSAEEIMLPLGARPYLYPRSLYLAGLAYERKGEAKSAIASYEKLLRLWTSADGDLVTLRDAKRRLAALQSSATQ